ncbi:membrane protein, partial [Staphylococcus aureus]
MTNPNQRVEPVDETFQQPNIHRGKRYGKKKRAVVSMIIQIIVVILTAIAGYSVWK